MLKMNGRDIRLFVFMAAVFAAAYLLPAETLRGWPRLGDTVREALRSLRSYAREHLLLCLVPAFFIAGALEVFAHPGTVMRRLGGQIPSMLSYGVASVSGAALAASPRTILPLFAGIFRRGAGLGPAATFLYAGPATSILTVVLTVEVLGAGLGIARLLGAVIFGIATGAGMDLCFRRREGERVELELLPAAGSGRPSQQTAILFVVMVAVLVLANLSQPSGRAGIWHAVFEYRWLLAGIAGAALAIILSVWFGLNLLHVIVAAIPVVILGVALPRSPVVAFAAGMAGLALLTALSGGEAGAWGRSSWELARQILPPLFLGVLAAGLLFGGPGIEGLIPHRWVEKVFGGNSLRANLLASFAGGMTYFATLTEIPVVQGLLGVGMGKGPSLAMLISGPALSLTGMLAIRGIIGTRKTLVYASFVIATATLSGMIYGTFF